MVSLDLVLILVGLASFLGVVLDFTRVLLLSLACAGLNEIFVRSLSTFSTGVAFITFATSCASSLLIFCLFFIFSMVAFFRFPYVSSIRAATIGLDAIHHITAPTSGSAALPRAIAPHCLTILHVFIEASHETSSYAFSARILFPRSG